MIELHFNWIFVLIAGAIIFAFFITIVNKQREFSEIKTSGTIITNLESILTGAQVSTNTVNLIEMPKVNIGFECDRYFIGPAPKQTKGNVIFAPNLLKGKKIIAWALEWNLPYSVTNFLYITDPEARYVIVHKGGKTQDLANGIYEELPKEMNKEIMSVNEEKFDGKFKNKNNYKVKFIFLGSGTMLDNFPNKLSKMPNEDVTAIELIGIESEDTLPPTGKVEFFQKNNMQRFESIGTTFYLKTESLFGTIFAADKEMYDCTMKKAFKKLNLVTKIYLGRSLTLTNYYGIGNVGCSNAHSKAVTYLEKMKDESKDRITDFPKSLQDMEDMWDCSREIGGTQQSANSLAQLYSCALIY